MEKKARKDKLSDFNSDKVKCVEADELRDFLWDYIIKVQGAKFTDLPSLSLVAYRILADGRWIRRK